LTLRECRMNSWLGCFGDTPIANHFHAPSCKSPLLSLAVIDVVRLLASVLLLLPTHL
jgi:hypothetical protein